MTPTPRSSLFLSGARKKRRAGRLLYSPRHSRDSANHPADENGFFRQKTTFFCTEPAFLYRTASLASCRFPPCISSSTRHDREIGLSLPCPGSQAPQHQHTHAQRFQRRLRHLSNFGDRAEHTNYKTVTQ